MDVFTLIIGGGAIIALVATHWRLNHPRSTAEPQPSEGRSYYLIYVTLCSVVPPLLFLALWSLFAPQYMAEHIAEQVVLTSAETNATRLMLSPERLLALATGDAPATLLTNATINQAVLAYQALADKYATYVAVLAIALFTILLFFSIHAIKPGFSARARVERILHALMWLAAAISILTTIGIVLSVLFETIRFFKIIPVPDFLFGTTWSPQTAIHADQAGSSGAFGAVPLLVGTFLISSIALLVATPFGLISAIYMTEFSSARTRALVKPAIEILAGIPTVVYGFFAALIVAPAIHDWGVGASLQVSTENALAAGVVMGVMLIPFISSLSDDVLNAVPRNLYEGSLALGATRLETTFKIMVPAALPGIVSGILLAASRAIGETMIVVMAAGLAANLTLNPLDSVTTVTVQIQALLVGDQEFDSAKTLSAFALGFTLLLATLAFNIGALRIIRKYRERYE